MAAAARMPLTTPVAAAGAVLLALSFGAADGWAGPPPGWQPGVEGQWGVGPVVFAPDGSELAVTRWDRSTLVRVALDAGPAVAVSSERGAGFRPVWVAGGLLFKEVAHRV